MSRGLTASDVPNTWSLLLNGRSSIQAMAEKDKDLHVDLSSAETSVLYLYDGAMYSEFDRSSIVQKVEEGSLRLYIISAWYGIVDALEHQHPTEAR